MEGEVSQILLNQAQSSAPAALALPIIVLILVVCAARTWFVRTGRAPKLMNWLLWAVLIIVLLRDPHVQHVLSGFGINLATARLLDHIAIMYAAAVVWFLARTWMTTRRFRRAEVVTVLGVSTALSAWLWIVSAPARELNAAIEDFESWRTAAYLVPMSAPVPAACAAIIAGLLAHGWEQRQWTTWTWVGAALAAAILQTIDHISRAVSALFLSAGIHNELTAARTASVDELFLPAMAALALSTVPGLWRSLRARSRAAAQVKEIEPLWKAVTTRISGIAKPETVALPVEERVEEMLIEIEDGLLRLDLDPNLTADLDRARDVSNALEACACGLGPSLDWPAWTSSREEISRVAVAFNQLVPAEAARL